MLVESEEHSFGSGETRFFSTFESVSLDSSEIKTTSVVHPKALLFTSFLLISVGKELGYRLMPFFFIFVGVFFVEYGTQANPARTIRTWP